MFIPDKFFRNSEYLKFMSTSECKLYYFLRSNVIRKSHLFDIPYYHPAYIIYKNYFLNGFLVARYPQKKLAEILTTTENKIRERLKNLEQHGFIQKIKLRHKRNLICYYILGIWSYQPDHQNNSSGYVEEYYLDMIFEKKIETPKTVFNESECQKFYVCDYDYEKSITTPKWCGDTEKNTTPKWCGIEY